MSENDSHENNCVCVCHLKEAGIQLWDDIKGPFCLALRGFIKSFDATDQRGYAIRLDAEMSK